MKRRHSSAYCGSAISARMGGSNGSPLQIGDALSAWLLWKNHSIGACSCWWTDRWGDSWLHCWHQCKQQQQQLCHNQLTVVLFVELSFLSHQYFLSGWDKGGKMTGCAQGCHWSFMCHHLCFSGQRRDLATLRGVTRRPRDQISIWLWPENANESNCANLSPIRSASQNRLIHSHIGSKNQKSHPCQGGQTTAWKLRHSLNGSPEPKWNDEKVWSLKPDPMNDVHRNN